MGAIQRKLDILADNIANLNTTGYKRKSAAFEDILTNIQPQLKDFEQPGRRTPLGFTQGWGSRISGQTLDLSQGSLQETGLATDIAIEGNALFEVRSGQTLNSDRAFTRMGSFHLMPDGNGDGRLVTDQGQPVIADDGGTDTFVTVPAGYNLAIGADGAIRATSPDGQTTVDLGTLKLVKVLKPELLQSIGDNLYGIPQNVNANDVVQQTAANPGVEGGVAVRQGSLEQSNVNLTDEITELINVQRAYQLNARALSSADQMMQLATNLRA